MWAGRRQEEGDADYFYLLSRMMVVVMTMESVHETRYGKRGDHRNPYNMVCYFVTEIHCLELIFGSVGADRAWRHVFSRVLALCGCMSSAFSWFLCRTKTG